MTQVWLHTDINWLSIFHLQIEHKYVYLFLQLIQLIECRAVFRSFSLECQQSRPLLTIFVDPQRILYYSYGHILWLIWKVKLYAYSGDKQFISVVPKCARLMLPCNACATDLTQCGNHQTRVKIKCSDCEFSWVFHRHLFQFDTS